jgi:hypothetical protein
MYRRAVGIILCGNLRRTTLTGSMSTLSLGDLYLEELKD